MSEAVPSPPKVTPVLLVRMDEHASNGNGAKRFTARRYYDAFPILAPLAKECIRNEAQSGGMMVFGLFKMAEDELLSDEAVLAWLKKRYPDVEE